MYKNLQPILYDLYTYNARTKYILTSGLYTVYLLVHTRNSGTRLIICISFLFSRIGNKSQFTTKVYL